MSSTNFNVGLCDAGRNSSRVLKPPGGGHSQIFGYSEEEAPKQKQRQHNLSEINACFTQEPKVIIQKTEKKEIIEEIHVENIVTERTEVDKHENVENSAPEKSVEGNKPQSGPQRVRVPPGGFSSGFW